MVTYMYRECVLKQYVQDIECSVDISHHFCGPRNVASTHPSSRSGTEGRRGEGKGGVGREGRRGERDRKGGEERGGEGEGRGGEGRGREG